MTRNADAFYTRLMDLNVPTARLRPELEQLLGLREQMIQLSATMGMVQTGGSAPVGMGMAATGPVLPLQSAQPAAPVPETSFKGLVHDAMTKALGRPVQKGEVTYQHEDVVDEAGNVLVAAIIECPLWQNVYQGEAQSTKKAAEHAAAKEALAGEFPEVYAQRAHSATAGLGNGNAHPSAPKRKEPGPEASDPKSKLYSAMHILCERSLQRGDMVFSTEMLPEGGPGCCVCVLSMPCYDPNFAVQGEPAETKKLAEQAAAQAALDALSDVIEPAEKEHKVKKARLLQERQEVKRAQAALGALQDVHDPAELAAA